MSSPWRDRVAESWRPAVAEFMASAFVVYTTTAATHRGLPNITIASVAGLSTAAMAYATSALINPVLTAAAAAVGHLSAMQGASNALAQLLGALLGSGVLRLGSGTAGLGGNALPPGAEWQDALLEEAFVACFLVFAVLRAEPHAAPLVQGMLMLAATAALLPSTSCAVNPFRALAPALLSWTWGRGFWLFVVAPLAGGAVGAGLVFLLGSETPDPEPVGRAEPGPGPATTVPMDPTDMAVAYAQFRAADEHYSSSIL